MKDTQMRGRSCRLPGALLLVVVLVTTACAGGAPNTPSGGAPLRTETASAPAAPARPVEPEKISVAISARSLSFAPQVLAKSLGFFEQEGLDADVIVMRSDLQAAGLLSGELSYSSAGESIIFPVAEGAPVRTILVTFDGPHFTLVGQRGLDGARLKGGRVGVSRIGSASYLEGRALVGALGLNPDADVVFFATGETSTSFAALEAGNIEAAILSPPFSSQLVSRGYAGLARSSDLPAKSPFSSIVVANEQLDRKPDQAVRLIRALLRAMELIGKDKPRTIELLIKEWEIDPSYVDAVYEEMIGPLRMDGRMTDAQIQDYVDRTLQAGLIKNPVRVGDLVDFRYLERAQASR
jgi:ABC-type nitrate/sulfonate/bicarbonate transport system substrate-binding protein